MIRLLRLLDYWDVRLWLAGALALSLIALMLLSVAHDHAVADAAVLRAEVDRSHRETERIRVRTDSARVVVIARSDTVTRAVTRYQTIRDTVLFERAHSDTQALLRDLPVFVRAADSTVKACTEFQVSCARFRVVSDSENFSLRQENTGLRHVIGQMHRRGLLDRVRDVALSAAVGYAVGRVVH